MVPLVSLRLSFRGKMIRVLIFLIFSMALFSKLELSADQSRVAPGNGSSTPEPPLLDEYAKGSQGGSPSSNSPPPTYSSPSAATPFTKDPKENPLSVPPIPSPLAPKNGSLSGSNPGKFPSANPNSEMEAPDRISPQKLPNPIIQSNGVDDPNNPRILYPKHKPKSEIVPIDYRNNGALVTPKNSTNSSQGSIASTNNSPNPKSFTNNGTPFTPKAGKEPPTPQVVIQVIGAEHSPEDSEIRYRFIVQNPSQARAYRVVVSSPEPTEGKVMRTNPVASSEAIKGRQYLLWHFPVLQPGESKTLEVFVQPNADAKSIKMIGSVQFEHGRWIETEIVQPKLLVKKIAPDTGIRYEAMTYRLEIANTSKLPITDIDIEDHMDKGLEYEKEKNTTSEIDPEKNSKHWKIAQLMPGQKQILEYYVIPKAIGKLSSITRVKAKKVKENLHYEQQIQIQEAKLELKVTGPVKNQLINQNTPYQINVVNSGSAVLHNVRIQCLHSKNVEITRASSKAQFFPITVQWIIPTLPPGESKIFGFAVKCKEAGEEKLKITTCANHGKEQSDEISTTFNGIPAINWQKVEGTPVATIQGKVIYNVSVQNPGSAAATGVQLKVQLPPQVELDEAAPPQFSFDAKANVILFKPITLPARARVNYSITSKALKAGPARFSLDLLADCLKADGSLHRELSTTITGSPKSPSSNPPGKKSTLPDKSQPNTNGSNGSGDHIQPQSIPDPKGPNSANPLAPTTPKTPANPLPKSNTPPQPELNRIGQLNSENSSTTTTAKPQQDSNTALPNLPPP